MHQMNIDTLRQEAQRQLGLLKSLLLKAQQKDLIGPPAQTRTTFDTESLPKVIEVLDGEIHKLEHLDMVLAVVGTMKAGKSTSINAIVGAEVLPNRNRPMTALPTLIRHTPGVLVPRLLFEKIQPLNNLLGILGSAITKVDAETCKELESDVDMRQLLVQIKQKQPFVKQHRGEEEIFQFLKGLNDLVRLCFELTKSGVPVDFPFDAYGGVDAMPVIEVEFSHLKGMQATQGRLTLLDTPGPNEAGQQHLRKMLQEQLRKASAVLAVLDYTQLKSDADQDVRQNLMEISETARDRMYALVNKFDQKDRNSDDAPTVKNYVSQILMKGAMASDDVFPVSSKHGYLASRARNEVERHGRLNLQEAWAKDFAEETFGRRWEKYAENPKEIKVGADELWQASGFVEPLEQVIIKAHRNAALEALRSATSKLLEYAKDTGDFFSVSRDALTKDAKELEKNIENLHQDIKSINQAEKDADEKLKDTLEGMKKGIHAEAKAVQEKVHETLRNYLKEGQSIEAAMAEQKEREIREAKERDARNPLSNLRKVVKTMAGKNTARPASGAASHRIEGAEKSLIITFHKKEEANDFRGKIEGSIRHLFQTAEYEFQSCIEQGISEFNKELDLQRVNSLEKIKKSVQKNLDGFDIEVRLPKPKTISLDTSVAGILKNAVEEKTKKVNRSRRQSGVWGTVCRWFGTDDWGWEDYTANEDYYEVDLNRLFKSSNQGLKTLFDSAQTALNQEVYPQLHEGVDEFFKIFREKIENIQGDLMRSIDSHKESEAKKKQLLTDFSQLAKEAVGLEKDSQALDEDAESLFRQESVVARGEVVV